MSDYFEKSFETTGMTDVGTVRKLNEDYFRIDPEVGLLIVADGMGGHDSGEKASRLAVESVTDFLYEYDSEGFSDTGDLPENAQESRAIDGGLDLTSKDRPEFNALIKAVETANARIHDENRTRNYPEGAGIGTTVVGLWHYSTTGRDLAVFHVGDSRIYRMRKGTLTPMTHDHSLYQEWLDRGSEGDTPKKNIILRALGPWAETKVEIGRDTAQKDDIYLICSDGLCGPVSDEEIADILIKTTDLDIACRTLIDLAKENGSTDNITAIMARCL
ncbi:MAG: protein phosphatase 2C domain-containing protein [Pseudomonadota bacterium]|nr:protein phosphatase 2C domain-containing protein [Pseudomonadota bacterium]